jgi:anti-sigma regulatory factor (Ser/Thr protein kinase)
VYVRSAARWVPGAGGCADGWGGSGAPGGTVTVAVREGDGAVRVEVTDRGGSGVPQLRPVDLDAEGGRGLQLVAGVAARWGWRRRGGWTVTWFELSHG